MHPVVVNVHCFPVASIFHGGDFDAGSPLIRYDPPRTLAEIKSPICQTTIGAGLSAVSTAAWVRSIIVIVQDTGVGPGVGDGAITVESPTGVGVAVGVGAAHTEAAISRQAIASIVFMVRTPAWVEYHYWNPPG